jgi:type I restriction enzyme S subunit
LDTGDLVLEVSGGGPTQPVGRTVLIDEQAMRSSDHPLICSNFCRRLVLSNHVDPRFVWYQLHHLYLAGDTNQYQRATTNIRNLQVPNFLAGTELVIPPRAEQERIVAAIDERFSRLDAGVVALERMRRNLKRMRDSLLSTLADGAANWTTLGEIAEIIGGVTKDIKRQTDPDLIEVPYLRVANVQRGYLDLEVVTTIRVPEAKAETLYLQPGDILFNEGGDRDKLGRGWVWQGEIPKCIHQNHVFRARLKTAAFEPKFVSMHGNTFGRSWFEAMGKQTTNLASLNLTTLKVFPVPVMPISKQKELVVASENQASRVAVLDRAIETAARRALKLRFAILAAAFSGTLVGQDPSEEPASSLLQRITTERGSSNGRNVYPAHKQRTGRTKVVA